VGDRLNLGAGLAGHGGVGVPTLHTALRVAQLERAGMDNAVVAVTGDIEFALKTMKKLMLKEGTFKEMKKRAYYEKPSLARRRKSAEARRKVRKVQKRREEFDAKFENVKRRQDNPIPMRRPTI